MQIASFTTNSTVWLTCCSIYPGVIPTDGIEGSTTFQESVRDFEISGFQYGFQDLTEDFKISAKISRFHDFSKDFEIYISLKISHDFTENFEISLGAEVRNFVVCHAKKQGIGLL